jgi:hypothetical protein
MNRLKVTIKNDNNQVICKVGTSVPLPKANNDYSDVELAAYLREIADMLSAKVLPDPEIF